MEKAKMKSRVSDYSMVPFIERKIEANAIMTFLPLMTNSQ